MAITALQGLLKTMCTALGQPRLLGKMAHALCTRFTKRLENPQTFLPKSHVGLVLQRVAELSPEFSSSAYLTDTQLSRLKRIPLKETCRLQARATYAVLVDAITSFFQGHQPDLAWLHEGEPPVHPL